MNRLLAAALACCVITSEGATQINVAPGLVAFYTRVGSNPPPQGLRITSAAPNSWQLARPPRGWLNATPARGSTPDSLTLGAAAAGLPKGVYNDTLYLQSNGVVTAVPAVLIVTDDPMSGALKAAGSWAAYEVEFIYVGYTGLASGAPECKVNLNGFDRLYGVVIGFEPAAGGEDVIYTGALGRTTIIDFCETKPDPTPDQRKWCVVSLDGYGVVNAELTVHGEDGRGAYLKAANAGGPRKSHVRGDCDTPETVEARDGYQLASDLGAASPNGQPIDDEKAVDPRQNPITFTVNGIARLRVGTYPPSQPDGWTLHVVRRIP